MKKNNKTQNKKAYNERLNKHFREEKENFEKMQAEIAPFIRRRDFDIQSTIGEWKETSSYSK
jgi:hypothetical protein